MMEKELSQVTGISNSKVKMKEDTEFGEVFISIKKQPDLKESELQFSPVDVKNILISHQLTPIQFIESK